MNQNRPITAPDVNLSQRSFPLKFFVLVYALSVPFWLMGALTKIELLPGLPVAAFAAFCPMSAALILVYRENKSAGVNILLKRSFDFKRVKAKRWYAPALLIMPVASILSFGVLRLTGTPVPDPQIDVLRTLILCIVFFIFALGEELGWSGYAIDPLQDRWGALKGSLLLGVVWAVWHYVALIQIGRSIEWIAWWSLYTVAQRVIIVWVYNNAGRSVFVAALFHMMTNISWQLFPVSGSYFDIRSTGLILGVIVVIIAIVWEPHTLTRYRNPR